MKRFYALIVTTFVWLGASTGALAEVKQCTCACQCETSASPATLSATPLAVSKPPPPEVEAAPNNTLDLAALGNKPVNVELRYPGIANGHTAGLRWKSALQQYDGPVKTVSVGATSVIFEIPNEIVRKDAGQTVTLTASVGVDDEPLVISQPRTITVRNGTPVGQYPPPTVPSATAGQLDLQTLAGNPLKVTYTYDGIAAGHTVGIRWAGNPVYDTPHPVIDATPRPLEFTIPYEKVLLEKDKTVELTASVGAGGQLAFSAPLFLKVIENESAGEKIATQLNTRYNDTRATCDNNAPAYHCNGIIIRSTEDGDYDPWNPSPAATNLGGVSFSYMRKDAYVTSLYHASGFIFMPQDKAIASGKRVDYLCIYAYDAGTLVGTRGAQGCGLKPRAATDADPSTCRSVGVSTVDQWYAYTQTIPNRDYQCSLSTADATQFAASLQVRANRPVNMEALWNEMMVKTWPQNIPAQLPLESFFYASATGRTEAKNYQTKYKARTGKWLPIIQLNLNNLATSPFSYSSADQAIQP